MTRPEHLAHAEVDGLIKALQETQRFFGVQGLDGLHLLGSILFVSGDVSTVDFPLFHREGCPSGLWMQS